MKDTELMETGMDNSDLVYSGSKNAKGGFSKSDFFKGMAVGGGGVAAVATYILWRLKKKWIKEAANNIREEVRNGSLVLNEEEGDVESE